MKNGYFQIGEVSRITGLSKDTLHFYEKAGLLMPDYIDPENQYRYYSRKNLWQIDIITTCRKLSIPLEKVRQILSFRDNQKIVDLLMEYREEALRLSAYYQQVASDILWYNEENQNILRQKQQCTVEEKWLDEEIVIAGSGKRDQKSYHADLQEAVKEEVYRMPSIRKKYGYVLDLSRIRDKQFIKQREYLKIENGSYRNIPPENLLILPAGRYAVFMLHIQNETADFSPLLNWLRENHAEVDMIFAEEAGLQLFEYIPDYYCEIKAHLKKA